MHGCDDFNTLINSLKAVVGIMPLPCFPGITGEQLLPVARAIEVFQTNT
ncbi:MAG: hypothetical protein ACYDGS_06210 [Thermoleophilia bacterium]